MQNTKFASLFDVARVKYAAAPDPGHDFSHVQRVLGMCLEFGRELGADPEVLVPAALLHDVVNYPKNHPDRLSASTLAAQEAMRLLEGVELTGPQRHKIAAAIVEHSYSRGMKPSYLESAILQDADRLDAIGAVGIWRTATCGARMGASYYEPSDPWAQGRELDDKRYTLDHFYVKLFKLADGMNTVPGKREAERRSLFMRQFIEELRSDIRYQESETCAHPS